MEAPNLRPGSTRTDAVSAPQTGALAAALPGAGGQHDLRAARACHPSPVPMPLSVWPAAGGAVTPGTANPGEPPRSPRSARGGAGPASRAAALNVPPAITGRPGKATTIGQVLGRFRYPGGGTAKRPRDRRSRRPRRLPVPALRSAAVRVAVRRRLADGARGAPAAGVPRDDGARPGWPS
jgi:hypothetical protein